MNLSSRFVDALSFAIDIHRDQRRKGTEITYVSHLLAVSAIVLEFGGNEDQAIAGLLHDSLEDSDDDSEDIAATISARFGPHVEAIVRDCSDTTQQPKPPRRQRKESYLAHLVDTPIDSLLVSAADKLHNARATVTDLRTHGAGFWESIGFNAGPSDQLWYYRTLAEIFSRRFDGNERLAILARELSICVSEIEQALSQSTSERRTSARRGQAVLPEVARPPVTGSKDE